MRRDAEFILYRVRESDAAEPMLAMVSIAEFLEAEILERLGNEYALRDELDPQWAARPLELVRWEGHPALLLTDPGGAPLDTLIGQPMQIARFLSIASNLSAALAQLHARGIIHKDIKPANVLVEPQTGEVRLMGFGIATRQPRERQILAPPEEVAGTLAYMAPEQTGRMNRSIDSRSDLYALGVSFYEMLTGVLPFSASDPMELFHCHLARQAIPPAECMSGIPALLSAIIMKLLAKAADERYQTASGLENDLRRCLAQWQSQGRINAFALGSHDVSAQLLIPEKLYGREAEIDLLAGAFDRIVAGGAPELVLVSGYAGIGKSSVVGELHKALVPRHGLFAAGKFDQYKRDIPYATLAQAFQGMVHQILTQSEAQVKQWREELLAALNMNGALIVKLIPELELLIGKQPAVQELPPQEAQSRFQAVFRRFLGVFAQPQHPLVLFLDDLQWLDTATLELLAYLIDDQDLRYLLLIGAYRDNEVNPLHPWMRTLEASRKAGKVPVRDIVLKPLAPDDMERIVADTLHCERQHAQGLAALVWEKTGGNPFFSIQFIAMLAEQRLLAFDATAGVWTWDVASIRAKGFTDNVVDLMVGKLNRLPAATQDVLKLLGCLGNGATAASLARMRGVSETQIHKALWEAVRTGLVFRTDHTYIFLHDRIQQAAYSLIPESDRAAKHLRIGQLLTLDATPHEIEESIFEIVNQFNRGIALIVFPDERERLAELNLIAGRRAREATAYAAALSYLATGCALLAQDCWTRRYALAFALEFHRAECEYLTGALAAAEQHLSMLAECISDSTDLAAVTRVRVDLFTTMDRSDLAVQAGLDYLRRVGIQWPLHPNADDVRQEFERIWERVGERTIEELVDLPLMTDPDSRATMDVLMTILPPTLFNDQNLLGLVVGRMANISLEYGPSDGSCIGYAWLGMFLGPRFGNYEAGFRFAKLGLDLVDKRGLTRFKARVYVHFGNVVTPWTRHFRTGSQWVRRAFETANANGDLTFVAYSCNHLITNMLAVGAPLGEIQHEAESGLDFVRKARFGLVIDILTGQLQLIRTLRGLSYRITSFDDAEFDEEKFERHLEEDPRLAIATCWYWIRKLQARLFAEDYEAAVAAALKAQCLLWTSPSHVEVAEYHFYAALARAARCDEVLPEERIEHRVALSAHYQQLEEWARHCPENFSNRATLVAAEIARLEGEDLKAMHLYEQAIQSARENGFPQNEGLAYERAAAFYRMRGFLPFADMYLQRARDCYAHWGADGKVRQLEACHAQLQPRPKEASATSLAQLDFISVAKASQAISGRIVLDELIDMLMRIVIENAGAQSGCLILVREEKFALIAETNVAGQEVHVQLHQEAALPALTLPESILNYVRRSGEPVLLMDASAPHSYAGDPYFVRHRPKSVLCLPILRQAVLLGVLYLENNLVAHAFTPERVTVLEMLASQAAISLENAQLYDEVQQENMERKRAEEAVRDSNARIRRLIDSSIIGVFFWDLSGNITEANDAFLEMIAYSRQDLLSGNVHWGRMTPPEYSALDERKAAEVSTTRTCTPYEKEFIRKDGSRVPVLIGAVLFDDSPDHGVAFVLDLTERKQAEAEREARQAAEAANRAKSAFLANMSHELRTPLNGILGYAQILERDKKLDEKQRDGVHVIRQSGEHLLTLINDVLDLGKIEAGKTELYLADIPLARFVQTIVGIIGVKAVQKGLELVCDMAPDLPQGIRADEKRLRQVLLNLLSNAIKFTDQGHVILRLRFMPPSRLRFEVQDTGVGIGADQLEAIFQPFEQAGSAQRRLGGTGLGLTISRQYVRLMGGDIHVESQVGQGSIFWFGLEVQTVEAETVTAPVKIVIGYTGPRRKILVADDVAGNRTAIVDLLTPLGFDVPEAVNGRAALEMVQTLRPDLILMDIVMPEMDGVEATRRLRQLAAFKDVPVIAMSAGASGADREESLAAGMNAFLPKPIDVDGLFNQIAALLQFEWIYDSLPATPSLEPGEIDAVVVPPVEEMEVLHRLARLGNMGNILEHANYLSQLDERYRPFASQLSSLAKEYQSKAILRFVELCMNNGDS